MKKIVLAGSVMVLFIILMAGCSCKHKFDKGRVTKESTCKMNGVMTYTCTLCGEERKEFIALKEHEKDEGTVSREATFETEGLRVFECKICGEIFDKEIIPVRDDEVIVTVTDKINLKENWDAGRYYDRVEFMFKISNRTDKTINGIQGVLKVSDLFGVEIISVECDFTGNSIKPKCAISDIDLGLSVNQFIDSHVKLYNTDYSDLKFEYEVTDIVYADSTSKNEEPETTIGKQKVVVEVTGKESLKQNINAGRLSPQVKFSFNISNKTSKDIKGIQGIFTIKDMFGEDIKAFNLDFTNDIIKANSSVSVSGFGFEVNQFIDAHVKIFSANFTDLEYEYEVTGIAYTDGTKE